RTRWHVDGGALSFGCNRDAHHHDAHLHADPTRVNGAMATIADLLAALESIAPLSLAAEWDNVGLLLGDPAAPVERVMTCLTVTPDSVAEAIETRVQLIVSHHPIFFRPTKRLTPATAEGRMVLNLIQAA